MSLWFSNYIPISGVGCQDHLKEEVARPLNKKFFRKSSREKRSNLKKV